MTLKAFVLSVSSANAISACANLGQELHKVEISKFQLLGLSL